MPRTPANAPDGKGPKPAGPPDPDLTYEAAVEELESIIDQIESGDIGLEQSIRRYERGAALLKHCRSILDRAEQRITELDADALDRPEVEPGNGGPTSDPDDGAGDA